jgi:hypothetical protein
MSDYDPDPDALVGIQLAGMWIYPTEIVNLRNGYEIVDYHARNAVIEVLQFGEPPEDRETSRVVHTRWGDMLVNWKHDRYG